MSKSNIIKITSSLDLEHCKESLNAYEAPVSDRGIRFKDNLQWPDQYVITWNGTLHFKIANWVHQMGAITAEYGEDESWEVEVSGDSTQPVLMLQKHPRNHKNKILVFLGLALASAVLILGNLVPKPYVVLGWVVVFIVFFFRTFIFEDETALCARFLERLLNPENKSKRLSY